jgi:hypothetical protein
LCVALKCVALHEVERRPAAELLHRAQVDAGHDEAAREGVAQGVRRHALDTCAPAEPDVVPPAVVRKSSHHVSPRW